MQCSPSVAEPAGTRPWIPGSGFEPGPQSRARRGDQRRLGAPRGGDPGRLLTAGLAEREQVVERRQRTDRFERGQREDECDHEERGCGSDPSHGPGTLATAARVGRNSGSGAPRPVVHNTITSAKGAGSDAEWMTDLQEHVEGISRRAMLNRSAAALGIALAGNLEGLFGENVLQASAHGRRGRLRAADRRSERAVVAPKGFRYTILAQSGVTTLESGEPTPSDPDGMAAFSGRHGGNVLIYNHEVSGSEPNRCR